MSAHSLDCIPHLPVPIVVLDDNLNLIQASRQAFSLFKVRYREVEHKENIAKLSDVLLGDQTFVYAIGETTLQLTRAGSHASMRWQSEDQIYDIAINAMPNGESDLYFGLSFQNVTKRLAIEHSREITRNYLEQIIDSLPLGIVVIDREMRITAINRAQQEIMAFQGKDISMLNAIGTLLQEFLPQHEGMPWDRVETQLFEERKAVHQLESTMEEADRLRTFSSSVLPLLKENGEVIGAMHLTEDITEKLRLMADAREAEMLSARLETLQHTVVTLNHIINNKLTGMMCNIEVVRSTGEPLSPNKQRLLGEAQDEGESIAQFIRDLSNIKEIKITNYLKDEQMLDVSDIQDSIARTA